MLIEPASNVSVPFTVVMRTRSKTPDNVTTEDDKQVVAMFVKPMFAVIDQIFPEIKVNTACPTLTAEEDSLFVNNTNPLVYKLLVVATPNPVEEPAYPEVVTLPEPICTCTILEPFVDTALNITVIRLTQLGIEVKSILVPDVEACAVPAVITLLAIEDTTAPVIVGLDKLAEVRFGESPEIVIAIIKPFV